MKKTDNSTITRSLLLQRIIGVVTVLLITAKLTSPFLHTDEPHSGSTYTAIHCAACEYEATQATEQGLAILFPTQRFSYGIKAYPISSEIISIDILCSESRGPPQNS